MVDRLEPFGRVKFRVRWDGRVVPGVTRVGALRWTLAREAEEPATAEPAYAAVRIERGRTADTAFEEWAAEVSKPRRRPASRELRKTVVVELLDEAGGRALAFRLRGCVPLEYEALGPLDAADAGIATEALVVGYERFERDRAR